MAYELTFNISTRKPFNDTLAPYFTATPHAIQTVEQIVIKFADDDGQLSQVGTDATPARLIEDLVLHSYSGTGSIMRSFTIPAGSEVALSPATRVSSLGTSTTGYQFQGLLWNDNGTWKSVLPNEGHVLSNQCVYLVTEYPLQNPPSTYTAESVVSLPQRITYENRHLSQPGAPVSVAYAGAPDPQPPDDGDGDGGGGDDGEEDPPCYTPGTLIDTPSGPRPVEDLRAGDVVLTRDHGPQVVRWACRRALSGSDLDRRPNLRPVLIRAGALGPGQPARDLVVSPQHRVLLASRIVARVSGEAEVLVAAKQLLGWPGIEVLPAEEGVTYLHFILDRHEVVRANGCWSESLYLGPQTQSGLSPAARREIAALFPGLFAAPAAPAPARPFLRGKAVREVTRRAAKNARALVE